MRILLVDDDELFSHLLKTHLTEARYTVDTAVNGQEAWDFIEAQDYDLIVLDVILPKIDGISLCRKLRSKGLQVLVLLLTGRGTSADKIIGLDAGADDYLVKPVPQEELEARIRALLRRKATSVSPVLRWGNLQLDPSQNEVTYGGVSLNLTAKEYGLLELFMRNSQKIQSQSSILNQLWSLDDEPPSGDTLRALIKRLRQKLKTVGAGDLIETVYGLGYRLNPAFQNVETNSSSPNRSDRATTKSNLWEDNKSKILEQIVILEQATQNLLKYPLLESSRLNVKQQAHKLIGSLGIINLPEAAEMAQQIDMLLHPQISLGFEQRQLLQEQVQALRSLVEGTSNQLEKKPATNLTVAAPNKTQLAAQPRLLIVSEDREFTESLVAEATDNQLQTAIAPNPKLALDAIGRVRPDIVLLDMSLTNVREDGLVLLDELSKQTPSIPALVLTSDDQVTDRVAIARRKGRGFFQKPTTPTRILEAIAQTLKPTKAQEAKVMILDDDRMSLRLLKALLEPWGLQVTTINNPLQFWDELEKVTPDLLILDVQMPDIDGVELCQMLRNDSRWAPLPILFLTGQRDAEIIQRVFAAGADDYVNKPVMAPELITRIFNRLERTRLLRSQAEIDSLTGLPNRHRSRQDLDKFLHLARQYQQPFCLAALTLDNLIQINRDCGHRLGDQMLRRLADLLRRELRTEDIVARWEGAEFVVGMYGMTRGDGVEWLAQVLEMLHEIEFPTSDSQSIRITFSAGVAEYPTDASDILALYQTAGATLEKAKTSGGNCVLPTSWQPLQSTPVPLWDVILIHEETPFAIAVIQALLKRGIHVHWLKDGQTAIATLTGNNPSLHGRVILLSENLSDRTGFEVLKHLKQDKITQRSKVIWLSIPGSAVEKALTLGCFDYISVPSNISALMHHLRQALEV